MSCVNGDNICSCYDRGDYYDFEHFKEVQKQVRVLKDIILTIDPDNPFYSTLMNKIKALRGDWFIEAPESDYCFWNYIDSHDGRKHTLSECSTKLGVSISIVANTERKALVKLKESKLLEFVERD